MPTALIVDDEEANRKLMVFHCEELGIKAEEFRTGNALLKRMSSLDGSEIILLDILMPDVDGFELLGAIRQKNRQIPVIMVTALDDSDSVIRCLRLGATDYIPKASDAARLQASVRNALQMLSLNEQLTEARATIHSLTGIRSVIAQSQKTLDIIGLLDQVKETDATLLLLGESGVGKEIFARYVHFESARRQRPFIAVNCAAIPETLFESELFGHEAGAFTGATERRIGKFEAAKTGTIFLDEIGEMSMAVQARLLRVLQDRTVTPIGSNKEVPIKARVICATNKQLEQEVTEGNFRRDLYFRLNAFPVEIPPLRARREDIPAFARLFLEQACVKFDKDIPEITPAALDALLRHDWPGNVRELENAIERAALLCRGNALDVDVLALSRGSAPQLPEAVPTADAPPSAPNNLTRFTAPDDVVALDVIEKDILKSAVEACGGDVADTARRLGISRSTMYARMRKYAIDPETFRQVR